MRLSDDIDLFLDFVDTKIQILSQVQKKQCVGFYNILKISNLKVNLISRKETDIIDRHFVNSAMIAVVKKFTDKQKVVDIGSGGGFPGIILKIIFPETYFLLIESIKKKVTFLNHVLSELNLKKIKVVADRAEKISAQKEYSKSFDFVTARAVAKLDDLIVLSKPFLKPGGEMVFLKGKNFKDELNDIKNIKYELFHLSDLCVPFQNQNGVIVTINNQ